MDSMDIEERAGQWLARRDRDDWSGSDEAEFQSWLEQSTAHVVAFVRLEAAWKYSKRLKALSAGIPAGQVPSAEDWQLTSFFEKPGHDERPASEAIGLSSLYDHRKLESPSAGAREPGRKRLIAALAASVILATVASVAWYVWPTEPEYRTPVGGVASVPMPDGSKITLNTDSEVRVNLENPAERRVELQKGEAFFEVAKDRNRPFVVAVGAKRVIAVGTAFAVRRDGNDVRVAVTEGRVRIEDVAERSMNRDGGVSTLAAGTVAHATNAGILIQEKPIPEIENDLSWRAGYLIFRDTVLAEAAAEFNRYNTRKIVIEDPTVAATRVSGKFRSTQFEAFVRLLEEGFPIRAHAVDDHIVLTDSRSTTIGAASGRN
ncbi:MAG: FecR domain-containing protein [Gammaproteobacteria bacterium]